MGFARRKRYRRLAVLILCLGVFSDAALGQALEGNAASGLRLERAITPPTRGAQESTPVYIIGDRMQAEGETEVEVSGDADLRKGGTTLRADRIKYFPETDEAEALGNVRLRAFGDQVTGPRLRFRINDQAGIFYQPEFMLAPRKRPANRGGGLIELRGEAEALRFEGEDRFRITDGRFTSCKPGDDSWYVRASELDLDFSEDEGVARGGRLTFKGLTTPAFPYLSFSLSNARKSGFLPPTFGFQGKVGAEITVPFYWNIAPNQDATIAPRYMERRGLQLLSEYRYLQPTYFGIARYEYLPHDKVLDQPRYAMALLHNFNDQGRWSGYINFNKVSDDNYFRELSGRLSIATQIYLPRDAAVNYALAPGFTATARIQRFQTLQDPNQPVAIQYERVPQLLLTGTRQNIWAGLDGNFAGEFVSFDHPTLPLGRRTIAYPSLAYPVISPGAYITPKIGYHATYYNLSRLQGLPDTSVTRGLPIMSVDSGLTFERDMQLAGNAFVNTVEPRIYYLYIPYRRQDNIPLFDTSSAADFNYAQIFSENYYNGSDRISDANQLTFALTSRLIRADTGQETLRGLIGQRFYFSEQQVALNSTTPLRTNRLSSFLLGLTGQVYPRVTAEGTAQISSTDHTPERFNVGVRYQPELGKILNLGYRYTTASLNPNPLPNSTLAQNEIRQFDISGQWALGRGWSIVGRYNYSLVNHKAIETLAGFEYNGDCWAVRTVVQRFVTSAGTQTSLFFIQLELNGFSRIGSNPLEALRRNIPGYNPYNQVSPDNRPLNLYD